MSPTQADFDGAADEIAWHNEQRRKSDRMQEITHAIDEVRRGNPSLYHLNVVLRLASRAIDAGLIDD